MVLALTALLAVAAFACVTAPQARAVTPNDYFFMNSIGGPGTGPGTFGNNPSPGPYAVATDAAGNVYAVDPNGTALIQKFDPSGTLISHFGPGIVGSCYGIAVGPGGVVYVIDTWRSDSNRIQEFSSANGVDYVSAGHIATPEIPQGTAFHLAVDSAGNVYVTDTVGDLLLKYSPSGGTPVTIGAGVLSGPTAVAVDAVGDVYVSDSGHLMKFHSADGGATYTNVADWTRSDSGTATFGNLSGVAVDSSGNIFVVDEDFNLVTELSAAGTPLQSWGGLGSANYSFNHAFGIAVSTGGAVYVADAGGSVLGSTVNHRIMRYARDATAPVTTATVTPSAWTSAASVSVSLSASDPTVFDQYHSGLASVSPTQISLNGGSTWQDTRARSA
jgi:sugar lactone lactonase YvrE